MTRDLTITHEQSDYLAALSAEARRAGAMFDAAFTVIVRGHGLTDVRLVGLEGTKLTIEVPDAKKPEKAK